MKKRTQNGKKTAQTLKGSGGGGGGTKGLFGTNKI